MTGGYFYYGPDNFLTSRSYLAGYVCAVGGYLCEGDSFVRDTGLSQSLIPKPVALSDSGSSIMWWHVATYVYVICYLFIVSHRSLIFLHCSVTWLCHTAYGKPKLS